MEYLYGINVVFEAIRAGRRKVHRAMLSKSSQNNPRLKKLAHLLEERSIPLSWEEKGRLIDLCDSRDHQGAMLETDPYPYCPFDVIMTHDRLVLLDNIEDPHNTGAILRTAEVLGYPAILLPSRGSPQIYPSVVRVSAGASEHLHICRDRSANQYVRCAIELGHRVIALDQQGGISLDQVCAEKPERFILVIGGENKGVGQFVLNLAHITARIEQRGRISSLNASVAAAIALHALMQTTQE